MCACMLSHFSHVQFFATLDCSLPGSSAHGIFQTRILGGLPCPSPGDLPNPGIKFTSLMATLAGGFFTIITKYILHGIFIYLFILHGNKII